MHASMQVAAALATVCVMATLVQAAPQFAPSFNSQPALSRTEQHDDAGQFSLSYQTADGTTVQEQGSLKQTPDGSDYVLVKDGFYSYTSPEGTPVQVAYRADENGFQPQSPNIPVQSGPAFAAFV